MPFYLLSRSSKYLWWAVDVEPGPSVALQPKESVQKLPWMQDIRLGADCCALSTVVEDASVKLLMDASWWMQPKCILGRIKYRKICLEIHWSCSKSEWQTNIWGKFRGSRWRKRTTVIQLYITLLTAPSPYQTLPLQRRWTEEANAISRVDCKSSFESLTDYPNRRAKWLSRFSHLPRCSSRQYKNFTG